MSIMFSIKQPPTDQFKQIWYEVIVIFRIFKKNMIFFKDDLDFEDYFDILGDIDFSKSCRFMFLLSLYALSILSIRQVYFVICM